MGASKSKADKEESLLKEGIKFKSANSKALRLFFQSQFSPDMEEDDLRYLKHIFEMKTYLLFNSHYSRTNLIDTDQFLMEEFDKLVDTKFFSLKSIKINESDEGGSREDLNELFSYSIKLTEQGPYYICHVNKKENEYKDFNTVTNLILPSDLFEKIKKTHELIVDNRLNNNTELLFIIFNKVFLDKYQTIKKLTLNQGLKTIDESIFTLMAYFLRNNPQIDSVCFNGKTSYEIFGVNYNENEEIMESEIHNLQHIFNLYQVLDRRNNLIELRLLFFVEQYNFVMLANVIKQNKNLRFLQIRNMITKEFERELDITFKELNEMGETIKDEIFIFFNYVYNLEFLEEMKITHFSFNSEINFLACQVAKALKNLKILSLERNQGLINNDETVAECYCMEDTNVEQLNFGYTYFHMIRRFDCIINTDRLKIVDIGVIDFISLASFLKYIEKTSLVKAKATLNRPVQIDSISILFKQVSAHPFRSKNLRNLSVFNAYTQKTREDKKFIGFFYDRLVPALIENQTVRKLAFVKHCTYYFEVNDKVGKTFRYIPTKEFPSCINLIFCLKILFKSHSIGKVALAQMIKKIVQFRFADYRKIVIGGDREDKE